MLGICSVEKSKRMMTAIGNALAHGKEITDLVLVMKSMYLAPSGDNAIVEKIRLGKSLNHHAWNGWAIFLSGTQKYEWLGKPTKSPKQMKIDKKGGFSEN